MDNIYNTSENNDRAVDVVEVPAQPVEQLVEQLVERPPADPVERPADPVERPADPVERPADPVERPAESTPRPLTLTHNGERPFAGAVALYKEAMNKAIDRAVALLDEHPEWKSSRVMFNLFDRFEIPCFDIPDGKESVRKVSAHAVHYGPQIKISSFVGETPENFRERAFYTRDTSIWERMAPTGADGKKESAYPPFRELQMELATRRKLFLLDHSYHYRRPDGTIRYYQHIVIVRKLTSPVFLWHEYGLFPRAWMFN